VAQFLRDEEPVGGREPDGDQDRDQNRDEEDDEDGDLNPDAHACGGRVVGFDFDVCGPCGPRAEVARGHNLPAYVIFHDATLAAIAERNPASLGELEGISGMGAKKLEAYGAEVLRVCGA
jgi:hypothetical protein